MVFLSEAAAERESHDEVVLKGRLEAALARLNPGLPRQAREEALRRVTQAEFPYLLEENRRLHRLLTEGVDVEYDATDGTLTAGKVRLIDFDAPANNDWLAVPQFTVIHGQKNRRNLLRLRQVHARRSAERILYRLYRHPYRGGRRQHPDGVRQLHRCLRHQPRCRGWRASNLTRKRSRRSMPRSTN